MEKQVDSQSFDHSKETLAEDIISEHDSTPVKFVKTPEEKAFVRKLNWTVLPVIFLIVFIQVRFHHAFSFEKQPIRSFYYILVL